MRLGFRVLLRFSPLIFAVVRFAIALRDQGVRLTSTCLPNPEDINTTPPLRKAKRSNFRTVSDWTLVAEWIHFTLFGILVPTIKLKV